MPLFGRKQGKPGPKGDTKGKDKEAAGFLKEPWRHLDSKGNWNREYFEELLMDLRNHEVGEKDIPNIRILLLGPIGAGKSSFLNTVASIDKGRMSQITNAGRPDSSLTLKLKEFTPSGRLKNLRILDTMGVEDNEMGGLNVKDVSYIVKGNVCSDYKFNPASPIEEGDSSFRAEPKSGNHVHCIAFVIDANVIGQDNVSDGIRMKVKALQEEMKFLDIPRMVLLTKIDVLCELVKTDIENTYKSAKVMEAVRLAEELFQVTEQNIFPVQNYSRENELDPKKDILPLLALRRMVYFGSDFLNAISANKRDNEGS